MLPGRDNKISGVGFFPLVLGRPLLQLHLEHVYSVSNIHSIEKLGEEGCANFRRVQLTCGRQWVGPFQPGRRQNEDGMGWGAL